MNNNTDTKMYATGDEDQLQPIVFQLNNVKNKKEYVNRIINMMFPNQIILQHNKRLKTKEDQMILENIKEDIFNLNIDVSTTMRKYFKTITKYSEVETNKNVSFFNFRAEKINKFVQSKNKIPKGAVKIKDFWYYPGLELICKKYCKSKNVKTFTNYSYILEEINDKYFTIVEPIDNIKMNLEIKLIKYFKLPFCSTCHSLQGLSIDSKITLSLIVILHMLIEILYGRQ